MTLLKDIRLLLIIGLAILCLLALRLCSSQYVPQAITDSGADSATEQTDVTSLEESTESDAALSAAITTETTVTEVVTDSDTQGIVSAVEPETTAVETEVAEEHAEADPATNPEESTLAGSTEASAVIDQVSQADSEADEDVTGVPDSVTELVAATVELPAYEVVPSAIGAIADTEFVKIEIPRRATTGNAIPDLQTDIGSIKEGLGQYSDKLGVAKSLLESIVSK